jgi:hypothetical protein
MVSTNENLQFNKVYIHEDFVEHRRHLSGRGERDAALSPPLPSLSVSLW